MRGAALAVWVLLQFIDHFYSRASCEARLLFGSSLIQSAEFLLTRLMRGAAPWQITQGPNLRISTHAPHARRGEARQRRTGGFSDFYSRASCEARRSKILLQFRP